MHFRFATLSFSQSVGPPGGHPPCRPPAVPAIRPTEQIAEFPTCNILEIDRNSVERQGGREAGREGGSPPYICRLRYLSLSVSGALLTTVTRHSLTLEVGWTTNFEDGGVLAAECGGLWKCSGGAMSPGRRTLHGIFTCVRGMIFGPRFT